MAEQDTNERPVGNNELFSRELFIALEYLLKYSDKEHPAMASKIIKYAEENYGVKIERRHLSTVLWTLYSNNKFNELLGIKIDCKESQTNGNGEIRRKYYVASRFINTRNLANIISSIKAYSLLNYEEKNKLIDILLSIYTNENNKNKILNELINNGNGEDVSKLDRRAYLFYKCLVGHKSDLIKVKFFEKEQVFDKDGNEESMRYVKKKVIGYVHSIRVIDKELFVYILDLREMQFISINSQEIITLRPYNIQYEEADLKGLDILKKYNSIDEFLNEYKVIRGGKLIEVSFNVLQYHDIETPFKKRYGQEITRGELFTKKDPARQDKEYTFRHYSYMCDEREAVRFLSDPEILKLVYDIEPKYVANKVASKYIRLLSHCDNDEVTHEVNTIVNKDPRNHRPN